MNDVLPGHPDSLINEIDVMIAKTGEKSEMRNYLLWYFTNTYETSKVMSYDKIFVHMVDTYFTEQSYDWLHPTVQENMINRVNQMRNVLIGAYAPALIMADTGNQFIALHHLEAEYIIVLFWMHRFQVALKVLTKALYPSWLAQIKNSISVPQKCLQPLAVKLLTWVGWDKDKPPKPLIK